VILCRAVAIPGSEGKAPLTKSGHLAFKIVIKKGKILKINSNGNQPTSRIRCMQCALEFQSDHASSVAWGHEPLGAGLEGASTQFIQTFNKRVFQQKCVLKLRYFLKKKTVKSPQRQWIRPPKSPLASSGWGLRLRFPVLLLLLIDINLSKCFLAF